MNYKISLVCVSLFCAIEVGHGEDIERPIWLNEVVFVAQPFEDEILTTLVSLGVSPELAKIAVAQAKHETGNFTSDIFWENNNAFGMRHPKKRKTTSVGSNRGHAVYNSLADSIIDYFYYLEVLGYPLDEKSVYKWIIRLKNKRYFESSFEGYYKAVKYFYEKG